MAPNPVAPFLSGTDGIRAASDSECVIQGADGAHQVKGLGHGWRRWYTPEPPWRPANALHAAPKEQMSV
jgi:hypothetical protein